MKEHNQSGLWTDNEYVIYSVRRGMHALYLTNKGLHTDYKFICWDNVEFCCTVKGDEREGDVPYFSIYLKVPDMECINCDLPDDFSHTDFLELSEKANEAYNAFMKETYNSKSDVCYSIMDNARGIFERFKEVVTVILFIAIVILMFRELLQ